MDRLSLVIAFARGETISLFCGKDGTVSGKLICLHLTDDIDWDIVLYDGIRRSIRVSWAVERPICMLQSTYGS